MNSDRKLATILATDCVNFSKHMEESEEKTLRNLNECRKIIDAKIIEFGGRIFKTEGDSVVSEFASPVNCLKAAIEFISQSIGKVEKCSSVYKTAAWGIENQDDFYNQVILYVNQYKSGLKNINIALDEITILIEDELKS